MNRCQYKDDTGARCADDTVPRQGRSGRPPKYCAVHRREVTHKDKIASAKRIRETPCTGVPECQCDGHQASREYAARWRLEDHLNRLDRQEGGFLTGLLNAGYHIDRRSKQHGGFDEVHILALFGEILGLAFWFVGLKYRPLGNSPSWTFSDAWSLDILREQVNFVQVARYDERITS